MWQTCRTDSAYHSRPTNMSLAHGERAEYISAPPTHLRQEGKSWQLILPTKQRVDIFAGDLALSGTRSDDSTTRNRTTNLPLPSVGSVARPLRWHVLSPFPQVLIILRHSINLLQPG